MLVALTVRKLRPGAYEEFRRAWQPTGDKYPDGFQRAFHVRSLRDPDEVISFGFVDRDPSGVEDVRASVADVEAERQAAMARHVEAVLVDGVYEVVEEVVPAAR
jgi:heme-degrading monooxygenase HmoA